MPEKISIVKESGETINSSIVSIFMIPDTGKKYIITTENAVDPHGLTVLHVSEIVDGTLQKVATDEEWSSIKTIMRAIISGNVVSYQYLQPMETINAASQYSRDISVSSSASKQMVDNYNAADKTNSEESVSNQPAATLEENISPIDPNAAITTQAPANPTIFPTANGDVSGDEVVPGISEIPVNASAPTQDISSVAPVPGTTFDQPMPEEPQITIDPTTGLPTASTMTAPQITPEPPADFNSMNQMNFMNNMNQMNMGFSNDVQVVDPNQGVPTGQIVGDSSMPLNSMNNFPSMSMNSMPTNINPSFNPNATLDEVIVAAQEMFMVGVKNLVDTIEEKLYRDLYAKEADLKMREEAVFQKEQMFAVNPAMMGYNVGMMGMTPTMLQGMNQSMNQGMQQNMMVNPMMQNMGMSIPQQNIGMSTPNQFSQQQMMMSNPQATTGVVPNMGNPNLPLQTAPMPSLPITVSASNDNV